MANPYYDHTTYPVQYASGSSAALRAELDLIEAGFDKLPTLSGNGSKIVAVNSGGTALEAVAGTGTGDPVRATSPTLVTPTIGVATATSINGVPINRTNLDVSTSVAIGSSAAAALSSGGGNNVVIGYTAMLNATSAASSVIIGSGAAGVGVLTGVANVLIGVNAGVALTSGGSNVVIGTSSGTALTTGNQNTILGTTVATNLSNGQNCTLIGYQATPTSSSVSNEITLGNSSISTLRCQVTSITSLSDQRDKTDIAPLRSGIETVLALKPVTFTWNMRDGGKVGIKDCGFIAQDLQAVDDEHLKLVYASNPDKLEATYGRLLPVLVRAIQDLKSEIDAIRSEFKVYRLSHP